ncbi:hypothetical protein HWV62_27727 [Athelia sp. TMB]|nr:hypothetical protein HWV62_27727 [Athelia sp. TMB]
MVVTRKLKGRGRETVMDTLRAAIIFTTRDTSGGTVNNINGHHIQGDYAFAQINMNTICFNSSSSPGPKEILEILGQAYTIQNIPTSSGFGKPFILSTIGPSTVKMDSTYMHINNSDPLAKDPLIEIRIIAEIMDTLSESPALRYSESLPETLVALRQVLALTEFAIRACQHTPLAQALSRAVAAEAARCHQLLRDLLKNLSDYRHTLSAVMLHFIRHVVWPELEAEGELSSTALAEFYTRLTQETASLRHIKVDMLMVVDHLGRNLPVPMMFCHNWQDFHLVIAGHCSNFAGDSIIQRGDYQILKSEDGQAINRSELSTIVQPGMTVEMSIVLRQQMKEMASDEQCICPRCGHMNSDASIASDWVNCQRCCGRFQVILHDEIAGSNIAAAEDDNYDEKVEEDNDGEMISPHSHQQDRDAIANEKLLFRRISIFLKLQREVLDGPEPAISDIIMLSSDNSKDGTSTGEENFGYFDSPPIHPIGYSIYRQRRRVRMPENKYQPIWRAPVSKPPIVACTQCYMRGKECERTIGKSRIYSPTFTQPPRFAFATTAFRMAKTLTEAIKEDHEEMYEYHENYTKAPNADERGRWARQLTWEVARHAVGEEIVVYPLMEEYLGAKGKALADEDRAQHQHVKELLSHLESLNVEKDAQAFGETVEKVMAHLKPHNDSEEQNDLPPLEEKLGVERSKKEAARFSRTKKFVPTRAHPWAPNHPPFETVVGLMTAPIDKLHDMFASFPTEEMKERAEN